MIRMMEEEVHTDSDNINNVISLITTIMETHLKQKNII